MVVPTAEAVFTMLLAAVEPTIVEDEALLTSFLTATSNVTVKPVPLISTSLPAQLVIVILVPLTPVIFIPEYVVFT